MFKIPLMALIVAVFAALFGASATANSTDFKTEASQNNPAITECLQCEAAADVMRRNDRLRDLLAVKTDLSFPHWSLGQVTSEKFWVTPESIAERTRNDDRYGRFIEELRSCGRQPDALAKLAQQLQVQGRTEEGKHVLLAIVRMSPTDAGSQKKLGRKFHDGRWWDDEAAWRHHLEVQANTKRFIAELKPRLLALRRQVDGANKAGKILAPEPFTDTRAIPLMESILSTASEACAIYVISCLEPVMESEATNSLVRHAVYSIFPKVRSTAIHALAKRPAQNYIPSLIDAMCPAAARIGVLSLPAGSGGRISKFWYWQSNGTTYVVGEYWSQGGYSKEVRYDTRTNRSAIFMSRHLRDGQAPAIENENELRIINASNALSNLTNVCFGKDPIAWASWWAKQNDDFFDDETILADPASAIPESTTARMTMVAANDPSCFAAGTPVWTKAGLKPIDKLVLGEPVLSIDVESGELTYRPVVRRTAMRRAAFRRVTIEGENIDSTNVHPFWVTGKGWTPASKLSTGDHVRTSGSIVPIQGLSDGGEGLAYNLEVADFATYFVGKARVLVHDYSPIREAPRPCPGAPAFALSNK